MFTLDHLFDALQSHWETQADVQQVEIVAEDMIRLPNHVCRNFIIKTKEWQYDFEEWQKLTARYFTKEKIKSGRTSLSELRAFFDEDMLEFFEEYRPKLLFNDEEIDITEFLTSDRNLSFGTNMDT